MLSKFSAAACGCFHHLHSRWHQAGIAGNTTMLITSDTNLPQNLHSYNIHGCYPCRSVDMPPFQMMGALFVSVQFSSVTQPCPTLCDPMNRSTPGLPVHHQLPEFTQTHIHPVSDAMQPSHPLSSPSPPAPNPSQH